LLSLKLAYFGAPPGGRFWALADNQLFARITGGTSGTAAWYLTDWQGSVRNITDASGNLQDTITYDGFGNVTSESNSTAGDRYKYTARELDNETGLQYNRARYYDAVHGTWTSQDPLGFASGDTNLYRYVRNYATGDTDPSGLQPRAKPVPWSIGYITTQGKYPNIWGTLSDNCGYQVDDITPAQGGPPSLAVRVGYVLNGEPTDLTNFVFDPGGNRVRAGSTRVFVRINNVGSFRIQFSLQTWAYCNDQNPNGHSLIRVSALAFPGSGAALSCSARSGTGNAVSDEEVYSKTFNINFRAQVIEIARVNFAAFIPAKSFCTEDGAAFLKSLTIVDTNEPPPIA
jgi:RHS repeat-associated protein